MAKTIGARRVIETLWTGREAERIPFDRLTPPYVIKVNHSSGGNVFVLDNDAIDQNDIISSMKRRLQVPHGHIYREWAYIPIIPAIIVERAIAMPGGGVPKDYKFFVYHGRVHFIQVDIDRFSHHARNLYDREWRLLPAQFGYPMSLDIQIEPDNLEEMIYAAEKIGSQFDFVRVDLYSIDRDIFFGEATFYPEAGLGKFFPPEWDYKFCEPWNVDGLTYHAIG